MLLALADEVELAAASASGIFGDGCSGRAGRRRFGRPRFLLGRPLPEPAAVGVAVGGLGVFRGLPDAGRQLGRFRSVGGAGLLGRRLLGLVGFGRALRNGRSRQTADDAEGADAHGSLIGKLYLRCNQLSGLKASRVVASTGMAGSFGPERTSSGKSCCRRSSNRGKTVRLRSVRSSVPVTSIS